MFIKEINMNKSEMYKENKTYIDIEDIDMLKLF